MIFDLVADIGGTNARFAVVERNKVDLRDVQILTAAEFPTIEAALQQYLAKLAIAPQRACFAVACPPDEEIIQFTNSPWRFPPKELMVRFALRGLRLANDFEALAYGIAHLPKEGSLLLKPGKEIVHAPRGVIGPGTGLGVSGMIYQDGDWAVMSGEGGHIGFAPQEEIEIDLLRYAWKKFGRVSNERLLQGQGIVTLYHFFCEKAGLPPKPLQPAEIAASDDPQAKEAIQRFAAILGSAAGDLALMMRARGGIFIGGGIVPKILPAIQASSFEKRFCDKGRLSRMFTDIPIYVILDSCAALYGAAHLLTKEKENAEFLA